MKSKSTIKLTGLVNGIPCTSQNCSDVDEFVGEFKDYPLSLVPDGKLSGYDLYTGDTLIVSTIKHRSLNYYQGCTEAYGNKCQIVVRKMVATVHVWHQQ